MNFKPLQLLILFAISLSMGGSLAAQNNDLRAYTMEDGLPQSQVYDVIQDDYGYLWIGTRGGGLAHFDGDEFVTYNDRDGLASNYINSLLFANDTLFIGTQKGLSLKIKDRFVNFDLPKVTSQLRQSGKNYLGTAEGIYLLQKGIKPIKVTLGKAVDNHLINDLLFDGYNFWIASNKGLWKFSSLDENAEGELYETPSFTALTVRQNKLYAATFMDGILVIDLKSIVQDQLISGPLRVNSLALINNQLWVTTETAGVFIYDPNSLSLTKKLTRRNGLSVSHIRKTITDRAGTIWIATSGGGLYKYFLNEFTHYDKDTGLAENRVYATHFNGDELWISNGEAGLSTIDSLGIHRIPPILDFSEVKIKTITSDWSGDIWAGSDGKGILYRRTRQERRLNADVTQLDKISIDTVTTIKNKVLNESIGLPSNWIRKLYTQRDTVWAATYSDGIVKLQYNIENDQLIIHKTFGKEDGMKDLLIQDMKTGPRGRIWYATQSGHLGFIENKELTHIGQVLPQETPINTLVFRNNYLYLGTAGNGIWYASQDNYDEFKGLAGAKRLTSTNSYQLLFDTEENLWMGTERGVDKIILNKDNEIVDVIHFGRNDGFLGIETCLNAASMDGQGNLWFGAMYGLTKYDGAKPASGLSLQPSIHFESISVGYQSLDSLTANNRLDTSSTLQLKPDQNQVSFRYRTIDLGHPNEVEYRFKLKDSEWSPWSKNNEQRLAGLAFGAHQFTVQSRNYRWEESEPIRFSFYVESPLHKKAWFQWLIMGAGLLLILLITWGYVKRVKRKNKLLRQHLELENHLLSLEQKALRLQMNPHFIFNVLNGIKAMGPSNPTKMNATINSFATMLREVLYNSRKEQISLEQEIKTLKNYIEVELLMAPAPFRYDIRLLSDINSEEILIPPMLIQPFVENSIRHGILKSAKEGVLGIEFKTDEDFLYCTITDNGPGVFETQKTKTATDHQSMALTVTQERIESLSGKNALRMEEIKSDETIQGTRVSFKIPLETDY